MTLVVEVYGLYSIIVLLFKDLVGRFIFDIIREMPLERLILFYLRYTL
jgi:hypothetical protein